ncbi:MAG TPA: anti-sigma factor domain-containing protein [Bacillales bacterium]|nr:anti-sigma factor domain-containing protein [Bacillales bacterium]
MKRGVVMEVKRNKGIVLTDEGHFKKIHFRGNVPEIGQEIILPWSAESKPRWVPLISFAALLLILFVLGSSYFPFEDRKAAAYVSYDVNPSFSASVDEQLQVLSVYTWNEDAARLFEGWDSYRSMELREFSNAVLRKLTAAGYLHEQNHLYIATSVLVEDEEKRESLATVLRDRLQTIRSEALAEHPGVDFTVREASPEIAKQAKANGVSLGKYLLYLEAKKSGKPLSIDHIQTLSVSDIEHQLKKSDPVVIKRKTKHAEAVPNTNERRQPASGIHDNSIAEPPNAVFRIETSEIEMMKKWQRNGRDKSKKGDERKHRQGKQHGKASRGNHHVPKKRGHEKSSSAGKKQHSEKTG